MKRYTITLTDELHEWLSNESKERGIPMNTICILALENYQSPKTLFIPAEEIIQLIHQVNDNRSKDLAE